MRKKSAAFVLVATALLANANAASALERRNTSPRIEQALSGVTIYRPMTREEEERWFDQVKGVGN